MGKLTVQNGDQLSPVPGATISVLPDIGVSVTSLPDGSYSLDLPMGVYSVVFSGPNVTRTQVDNVSIIAGKTYTLDKTVQYTPIKLALKATPVRDAGFGNEVTLEVAATGTTTPDVSYTWEYIKGNYAGDYPAAPEIEDADKAVAKFTTASFDEIAPRVKFLDPARLARPGVVQITTQQARYFSYTFKVTVTDGVYRQTGTVNVTTIPMSQGVAVRNPKPMVKLEGGASVAAGPTVSYTIAKDMPIVLTDAEAESYDWVILSRPPGSTATLTAANTRNPSFRPDQDGLYLVKNNVSGVELELYAASFVGLGGYDGVGCTMCHASGSLKLEEIDEWKNSAHGWHKGSETPMTLLEFGLRGLEADPAHYGENCVACHAAGYSKSARNGGFDDLMADLGWTFPANAANLDNWTSMPGKLKNLAGMQCEACHGPAGLHYAGFEHEGNRPTPFYDSQTCGTCHDALGHHDRFQLWSQAGHANLELAIEEGTRASCAKCHSAQGFVQWADAGFDPGFTPATAPSEVTVEPITCQACHDPHTAELRVSHETPVDSTSGFTVIAAGEGQICTTCHSNRRGARYDGIEIGDSAWFQLPHGSAQSDLFFGENAFSFTDRRQAPEPSAHAYVLANTCVTCHMEPELAAGDLFLAPYHTNHSFKPSKGLCAQCHHDAALENVQHRVEALLVDVKAELEKAMLETLTERYKVPGVTATYVSGGETLTITGVASFSTPPSKIEVGAAGQHGHYITMTWEQPASVRFWGVDNGQPSGWVDAQTAAGLTVAVPTNGLKQGIGTPYADAPYAFGPGSDILKAFWNYYLIEEDQSLGAHNPTFAIKVLNNTKAALQSIPRPPL